MQNSKFNCIAILDAIPDGELNTARSLYDDLLDIRTANAEKLGQLQLRYFRIKTETDLENCLIDLIAESEADGLIPWLHLEGHGLEDKTGFVTANNTPIAWKRFNQLITPLNVSTKMNLVLVLASCYGAYYIHSLVPSEKAPILALIGPINQIIAGDVVKDFRAFYFDIFDNFSFGKAVKAIANTNAGPIYYATHAEELFLEAWKGYRNDHCSKRALKTRALALIQKLRSENPGTSYKIGWVKKMIRIEEPVFFDSFRDEFFQYDIYPENKVRFPITYQKAMKYNAN